MIEKMFYGKEPYIIAEVSQNHDGSLGQAHAFIDAVAQTGVDAIKFQTHIASEESTKYEPFRVKFSYEDATRYDYWKRMEFSKEQWKGLYDHAKNLGLDFLSSPFSEKALDMLDEIGIPAWKFGAGEVFNEPLMRKAISTKKPIILSTGLSTYDDIDKLVNLINENGNKVALLQCVTAYPSSPEMIDINQITELKKRYPCIIGISDHSSTIYPSLAAVTLGAKIVEVHVTMSKYMFGPDIKASVDVEQLAQIVEGSKFITKMLNTSINMRELDDNRANLRKMFSKCIYTTRQISKGEEITSDKVALKKPYNGAGFTDFSQIVGKKANRDIDEEKCLIKDYLE